MPPLLRRILKLRKISAKHVLNNKGKNVFWQPQKVIRLQIFQNFENWYSPTDTNSSLLPNMTFTLKMTKFTIFSSAKG